MISTDFLLCPKYTENVCDFPPGKNLLAFKRNSRQKIHWIATCSLWLGHVHSVILLPQKKVHFLFCSKVFFFETFQPIVQFRQHLSDGACRCYIYQIVTYQLMFFQSNKHLESPTMYLECIAGTFQVTFSVFFSLQNGNKTYTTGSYFMFEEVQIYYYFLKLISSLFCLFIYIQKAMNN